MILKFRAWDKKNKLIKNVITIYLSESAVELHFQHGENPEYKQFHEVVLMQSTGLRDKNSVEIFEGDIIMNRYGDYSAIGIGKYDREYLEEFDNHPTIYNPVGVYEYMFNDSTGGKLSYEFELSDAESSEVVGNIWEDRDLLDSE